VCQVLQTNDDRWPRWEQGFGSSKEDIRKVSEKEKPKPKKGRRVDEQKVNQQHTGQNVEHGGFSHGRPLDKKQDVSGNINPGQFMKYTSIGTELLAAVLVGTFLGWAVNRLFGNRIPWVMAIGVVIGAMAGLLNIYRFIVEEEHKEKLLKEESKQASSQEERDKNAFS
jgi:F0F1-type ATP synthase assembly protein I